MGDQKMASSSGVTIQDSSPAQKAAKVDSGGNQCIILYIKYVGRDGP